MSVVGRVGGFAHAQYGPFLPVGQETNTSKTHSSVMASQNNNNEVRKVSKKLFTPPLANPRIAFAKGEPVHHRKQEDGQADHVPLNCPAGNGSASKPMKAHYPKANPKGQEKKQKGSTKVEKGAKHKKEDDCLSDSLFEEIVESVLKKSLEECMEDFKKIAPSAEEQGLGRETVEASPPPKETVPGKASRDESEVMLVEAGQQEPRLEKRRHGKPSVKDKNENPEADNGGRKEKRKGAPKKKVQGNAQIADQEEKQKEGEEEEAADEGSWCVAWVQCSYPACGKWRRLCSDVDPSVLPDNWSCSENPDLQYNSCGIPEETWLGSESEVVYAIYIPGSIVWAKQYGYPWWPGMIEADPDIGEYFLFSSRTDSLPSKYHVTFFGDSVSRAWISASMLRNFGEPNAEDSCLAKSKVKGDRKNLERAQKMAKEAEQISIPERIRMFGFCSRFRGKDHKDLDNFTCHPHAKNIEDPGVRSASTGTSTENQDQLVLGAPGAKPDGKLKKKTCVKRGAKSVLEAESSSPSSKRSQRKAAPPQAVAESKAREPQEDLKGPKMSSVVPRCNDAEAKQPSGHPGEKGSLNQTETSEVAENNQVLNKVTVSCEEPAELRMLGEEEEEFGGSPEMTVSAEEKKDSLEDFSLALFEE
ncbi:zinc finger CW-type PWWP domain protein 1 isoform X3 [Paroedura picta]|uniref:zinc finger CW-type PWWP domain protein 1 isoform X3 n=1 Tax=Paroedura picta TaxID=143630 RepID=UPI00405629EC